MCFQLSLVIVLPLLLSSLNLKSQTDRQKGSYAQPFSKALPLSLKSELSVMANPSLLVLRSWFASLSPLRWTLEIIFFGKLDSFENKHSSSWALERKALPTRRPSSSTSNLESSLKVRMSSRWMCGYRVQLGMDMLPLIGICEKSKVLRHNLRGRQSDLFFFFPLWCQRTSPGLQACSASALP